MNDSLTEIAKAFSNSSPLMFLAVVGSLFVMVLREYYRYSLKLREINLKMAAASGDPDQYTESSSPSKPQDVASANFRILERYYEQHLVEYRLISRATLAIAILGFLIIATGVFFTFSENATVGVLTSVAGIISEAVSVLFFRQNKLMVDQIQDYHKKLVSTQYLITSISLASNLSEVAGEVESRRIITNLLFLSNELHGANSDHILQANSPMGSDVKYHLHADDRLSESRALSAETQSLLQEREREGPSIADVGERKKTGSEQ